MGRPLRVAIATPWPPWNPDGGTERHTDELARALCRQGVDVVVITIDRPGRDLAAPYHVASADSGFLAWLRRFENRVPRLRPSVRQLHEVLFNRRAARLAVAMGAHVLHRQGAYAAGFRPPLPLVVTVHNGSTPQDELTPAGWRHRVLAGLASLDRRRRAAALRRCLLGANEVICVSEHVRRMFVERLGAHRQVHEIENGCSYRPATSPKREARRALGVPDGGRLILFVGRLSPEKRVERLLPLLELDPTCHVVLLGRGDVEPVMRRIAAGQPRLHVLGFQPEEAKRAWLRAADVLALPSGNFEGNPIVMLEALRSGTPVYGTIGEWLPPRLRRFGKFGDDVALALEAAGLDATAAQHGVADWDDVAAKTASVYRRLVPGSAPPSRATFKASQT